jgi:magnesium chelatase family protein
MKIFSFTRVGLELQPIEVEVSLIPGLPLFEVIGMADPAIKESLGRLRSAIRSSNYELPKRQRVVFNLRPAYSRKKSEGLDLAFAVGYLLASKQLKIEDVKNDKLFVYGELGLEGEVTVSSELELLHALPQSASLLTGANAPVFFDHYKIGKLAELDQLEKATELHLGQVPERPMMGRLMFDSQAARLMAIIAAGEHPTLLAGPAGSGKSTWVQSIHSVLRDLNSSEQKEVRRIAKVMGREADWRPFVAPHHSVPALSLIGGGAPPFPGEITRAHRGLLFLDEFFEFSPAAKEAFREPMETGEINISRKGVLQKFPADSLVVAATNLCPCGDWVPKYEGSCNYTLGRCRSYMQKLSGPLLDRFDVLALSSLWKGEKSISLDTIRGQVERAQNFALQSRGQTKMNAKLSAGDIAVDTGALVLFNNSGSSLRRERALLRVARTIADLEGAQSVGRKHLGEAFDITWNSFKGVKRSMN